MMIRSIRKVANSIRFKLMAGAVCVLFTLIALLMYDNIYATRVIYDQIAESNQNLLSQYMSQIDGNLEAVDSYLNSMAALNFNIRLLCWSRNDADRLTAKYNLIKKLKEDIIAYRYMDSLFVYHPGNDDFIYSKNGAESLAERTAMREYIRRLAADYAGGEMPVSQRGWRPELINGQYYLIRIQQVEQAYVGAWVRAKELLFPLEFIDMGDGGAALLVTSGGRQMAASAPVADGDVDFSGDFSRYYLTGTKGQYLLVGSHSVKGEFSLVALIQDKKILENLPVLRYIITVITIIVLLLVPLCLYMLNRVVVWPIKRLLAVMKTVGEGDMEVRISHKPASDEFIRLNTTFNDMLDQIHELKIDVYEEQLNVQKAELRYTQMQVNPHFFLNSLNMIYRMAQMGKYNLIQDMVLCLLNYFRYVFKHNSAFVPLRDEIGHVKNYIHIQEMRFSGHLFCHVQVDEALLDRQIPPLTIQSLVENAAKYAVSLDDMTDIHVEAFPEPQEDGEYMKLVVWDTGKGFDEPALVRIQAGERLVDSNGEHTGLFNLRKRLLFLYDGDVRISFGNRQEGGAVITIILPLNPPEHSKNTRQAVIGK